MMNYKSYFSGFNIEPDNPNLPDDQRKLYRTLHAVLSNVPLLSLFITLGFGIIYLLGLSGLLDRNEPRLLIIAGIAATAAILHIPLFELMRRGERVRVAVFLVLINCLAAAAQVFIWQGIVWLPLAVTTFPLLLFVTQHGIKFKYRALGILFGLLCLIIILYMDRFLPYERMSVENSLTQMAALAIYIMVVFAMAILVILNSQINFRTISSRLATTFTFIALLSSVATLIIAALANIYFDRQKIFTELNAASKVRADQVGIAFDNMERDVNLTLSDPLNNQFITYLLNNSAGTPEYSDAYVRVRSYLLRQEAQYSRYQELFLLDTTGKTIISTFDSNIGFNFSSFNFFQNTKIGINYSVESDFPSSYDKSAIIITKPFVEGGILRGVLAARLNFDTIKQVLSANTGIGNTAETYVVGLSSGFMIPISNTRHNIDKLNTRPAEQALLFHSDQGSGIWDNYKGITVLGSYVRIPALKEVLIAEIEQQEVTQKTINISLTNAIIGMFTLLLTFTIVFITSRSIGLPIVDLAENATKLANGELSTRIQINREDEIGTLASSFNSMASELQTLVSTLEEKVEDRTRDLRKQSNYLRVAAEVARDATTAQSLDELLNRASQLVLDRFGFYHTGIFILDEHKEFAILRASPTKAGLEMLARHHKLKVGQVGIVGNVASTGVSRIALDTGRDTTYFNNPLLPNTRSEMALPLKVNDELIGVLDVQSDQAEAFTQEDIGTLQIMADQLASAIQRVRLTKEQEENLRQLESANQRFTLTSWNKLSHSANFKQGYSFDGLHLVPLANMPKDIRESLVNGKSIVLPKNKPDENSSTLAVPLKLRDQVIGALLVQFNNQTIASDTVSLVEETAAQLAIALENARLYTETQKAADRERSVSQITTRIRSTNDPNEMIQIALNELKQTLHVNDARILPYNPPQKSEKS
jgi:GAF domain-containing protein/HAMP domain-containing protein